mgnify:CR=1 FL=1
MSILHQLVNKIRQYGKDVYVYLSQALPELRIIQIGILNAIIGSIMSCLLYTSDAADE